MESIVNTFFYNLGRYYFPTDCLRMSQRKILITEFNLYLVFFLFQFFFQCLVNARIVYKKTEATLKYFSEVYSLLYVRAGLFQNGYTVIHDSFLK